MAPRTFPAWTSWTALAGVAVLCALLGGLQYRWIGQVGIAERERLHDELQNELGNVSRSFNREIGEAFHIVESGGRSPVFRQAERTHDRPGRGVLSRFVEGSDPPEWFTAEVDIDWVRNKALPPLLSQPGLSDFDIQIVTNDFGHPELIYTTGPKMIIGDPDASQPILDLSPGRPGSGPGSGPGPGPISRGGFGGGFGGGFRGGRRGPPPGEPGLWRILAKHRNGSLEAVVASTQRRNLAVSGAILLLILGVAAMLIRVARQAQQLADAHIGFVAGVSHELRTPLTVIRTAAFNLTNGKMQTRPEQIERYGRLIAGESEKLEALIDQVLRFAGGRAGHAIRERRPLALAPLIEDEVNAIRPAAERDGVAIELKIEANLPLALVDDRALRPALRNLLDNALRYGRSGREVRIFAKPVVSRGVSFIEIEVADRGPGIPSAEIGRVFDPFFRGSRALKDQIHGTGLGLNIVRTIAEAHGGSVTVTSEPGAGTHFFLRLPCAEHRNSVEHQT